MRKFIIAGMALAMLAIIPAAASADVQRIQPDQTGTLAVHVGHLTDPASESTHFYPNVTVKSDGTFTGTDGYGRWTTGGETITGKIVNGKVTSFTATMWDGGYVWTYDSTIADPKAQAFDGYQAFSVDSIDLDVSGSYENHGQFVKAQVDKNDAAHSAIGMPLKSNK